MRSATAIAEEQSALIERDGGAVAERLIGAIALEGDVTRSILTHHVDTLHASLAVGAARRDGHYPIIKQQGLVLLVAQVELHVYRHVGNSDERVGFGIASGREASQQAQAEKAHGTR